MDSLNSLPGDIQAPLDPSSEPFELPVKNDDFKLPVTDSPLLQKYKDVVEVDPDRVAKVMKYSGALDENPYIIDKNLDRVEKIMNAPDSQYWNDFEKRFPKSAEFLKDSKNMAIARDDLDNLSQTEQIAKDKSFTYDLYASMQSGLAQMYSNAGKIPALAYSVAAYPQNQIAELVGRDDLQVRPPEFLTNNPVTRHYDEQAKAYAPAELSDSVTEKFKQGDYTEGAKTLILQVAQNAPQQLLNIGLALTGAGLPATFATTGSIQAAGTLKESLDSGASPTAATINAVAQGSFESLIENMSFGTTGSIRAAKELGEVLTAKLGKEGARKAMVEVGKQIVTSFGNEAFEEGLTTIAQNSTAFATGVNPQALDNIGQDVLDSAIVGGASGGGMTSIGVLSQKAVNARKTSRLKQMYLDLGKTAEQSRLRERLPEAHAKVMNEITKGGPIENIFIPVEEAQTYFQSKNIDLLALGKELGIENEVQEAIETGGDIKVPLSTWANKMVGTEHYEGLKDSIKFNQEDFTTNQLKELDSEITNQLSAADQVAVERALEDDGNRSQAETAYSDIKTDLINAGQDGDMAEQAALVYKSAIVARAAKRGISIEQSHSEMRPQIINGDTEVFAGNTYKRKSIPKFESEDIANEDQIKSAIQEIGLPETYLHPEALSAIRAQLAFFKSEIEQAEAGKRTFREGGQGGDVIVEGVKSTFPQWFRDQGFKTKKDFIRIVSKGNSKNLSKLVEMAIKTLKEGHGDNPSNALAPNLDFVSLVDPESLNDSFEAAQSIKPGKEFGQGDQTKRGSIQFQEDVKIIRLFKSADKSTFVHELGHLFLEDMYNHVLSGDASNKEMNDWMKLSAWLDYNPAQEKLTVDQHEKFARGFEAYLMEGKAPSKSLARAFGKFRRWLTRIYKTIKNLDVELNDDVREIMDRMLATEEEIAIAKKKSSLDIDIDVEGLSDTLKTKLQDIRLLAEEKAFATLMKDQMKEISEERKKFVKNKRKEITAQVKEEIENSPEGAEQVDIREGLKTRDIWKRADQFINGLMTEEETLEFEMFGESLGYTSGDHFAQSIKKMIPVKEQIASEVNARMKEFESITDKEVIQQNALEAIHNEHSVELMALEKEIIRQRLLEETEKETQKIEAAMERADEATLKKWLDAKEEHLQKKAFNEGLQKGLQKLEKEVTRLSEREKERRIREDQKRLAKEWLAAKDESERKAKLDEFRKSVRELNKTIAGYTKSEADTVKQKAKEILSKKPIKESVRFTQYFTAEKNAALRVAKAIRDNDWEKAIVAKQEQMLNHALAKEALRIKKDVARHTKYLDGQRTASIESFKNEDHLFQVGKILERFGFGRTDFDLRSTGATLSQWITDYDAMTGIVAIEDWLTDERINIKTNELTIEQLRDIRNAVQNIKQVANYENQISKLNGKQTIEEIATDLISESQANFNPKDRFSHKFEDGRLDKLKGIGRLYMFSLKKIETVLGPLGAWRESSLWLKYFKDSVYESSNEESRMRDEAAKAMAQNWAVYTDAERKDIYNKKIFIPEFNISMTKEKLLAMAHNLGNDGNRDRLFATRPVGLDQSVPWGEGMVMSVLQRELSVKDWKFVQSNWDHLESYWGKISSLHKRLTGFTPGKVEHRKFSVISEGQKIDLNGGYYPLKADPRNSLKDEIRANADDPLYTEQNMAWKAATKKGHTKERQNATYPVLLDLNIIGRHLNDVIHDLTFRETVIELNKLIGREDVQKELQSTITPEGLKAVKEYIGAIAGNQQGDPLGAIDKVLKGMRQNTTRAALMMKLPLAIQNMANIVIFPNATEGFGYKETFTSLVKYGAGDYYRSLFSGNGKQIREEVYSKSAFMKDRSESSDYSIVEVHSKFSKDEESAISKFSGGMMAFTDELINLPMWKGAYNKAIDEGKSEQEAIRYADRLIMNVSGSSRKYDVAGIARGSETQKLFSMFFSFMNTLHNRWMREMGIIERDKDVGRAFGFLAGQLAFQIIGALLMGRLPDGEDEEENLKFAVNMTVGLPVAFFPGLREVATVAMDKAMGINGFAYTPSPAFASIDYGIKGFGAAIDSAKGEIETDEAIEKVSKAAAYSFGYPDQFNQWFFNMYDYTDGMEPKLQDIYKRRPKKER